jgi:hypothetical protein
MPSAQRCPETIAQDYLLLRAEETALVQGVIGFVILDRATTAVPEPMSRQDRPRRLRQ